MSFWYDGTLFGDDSFGPAFVGDEGLRFGASVFTTMRVYETNLHHPWTQWQAHCDRLAYSIQSFSWKYPNWADIKKGCQHLKGRYLVLRITVFPDGREWITGRQVPTHLIQNQKTGITCWIAPAEYSRSLPAHKTGNYLACWLSRQQARACGADEAILTSPEGEWLETATGNLWGWANGQWFTPMTRRCLPGIMRHRLQQILVGSGQKVGTQKWDLERVISFEAIAYSNCVVQLLPIHTILNGTAKLEYDPSHEAIRALQQQLVP